MLDALARRYWRQHARTTHPSGACRGSGPSCCAAASRRGWCSERLRALWPRWADALEGLEPAEPVEESRLSDDWRQSATA